MEDATSEKSTYRFDDSILLGYQDSNLD